MPKHLSVLLYVHGNHKAHQDGEPGTATSTCTQLLNSDEDVGLTYLELKPKSFENACVSV